MFFLYSRSCEYAVRALVFAAQNESEYFKVDRVCKKARVPIHYARKALEVLADEGVLEAIRGRSGGFRFVVKPKDLSILRLIEAIDGKEAFNRCVMGLPHCGDSKPCPLHLSWQEVKNKYLSELQNKSLLDLLPVVNQTRSLNRSVETKRDNGVTRRKK